MSLELVVNDLSLTPPADSIPEAQRRMVTFLDVVRRLGALGCRPALRVPRDLHEYDLAPGYPLARWRNDFGVDRELRRFWTVLVLRFPYLDPKELARLDDAVHSCEFYYHGEAAGGLGAAYLVDGLALSLLSAAQWSAATLEITMRRLQDNGVLSDLPETVHHASQADHVQAHRSWLQHVRFTVRDWNDLWLRRAELFPSLVFCESVARQIGAFSVGDPAFHSVRKRLFELESYFSGWKTGAFHPHQLSSKATPESMATLRRYSAERTFTCPDGRCQLFSWHVRFTPGAGRILFEPEPVGRKALIGYIGPKLPTVLGST